MQNSECPLSARTRHSPPSVPKRPWNAGRKIGKKRPLTSRQAKRIRHYLKQNESLRNQALFALGYDCALRSSDIRKLTIGDVLNHDGTVRSRFALVQTKTKHPVECVIDKATQKILTRWIKQSGGNWNSPLFPSRTKSQPLSLRQHQRLIKRWVAAVGLCSSEYSSHTMRRTKATIVYAKSKNLEFVRLVLGQRTLAAAACYLGVTSDQALAFSQKVSIGSSFYENVADLFRKHLFESRYKAQFQAFPVKATA